MTKEKLKQNYPDITCLSLEDTAELEPYLRAKEWLRPEESLEIVEKAGEGNMNCTLRVVSGGRSLILKQSRPWVEKYPDIAAPWDRILREGDFYRLVKPFSALAGRMPRLLWLDPKSRIMACEDLGRVGDFTDLYRGARLGGSELVSLADWLSKLHGLRFDSEERKKLGNREMCLLNHEHIFLFPLRKGNGLELDKITPGLQDEADNLKEDYDFTSTVQKLGETYLHDGDFLLHGDFFPGSWLRAEDGIYIIDPEFCFFGQAEFDVGVCLAHFYLSGQAGKVVEQFLDGYQCPTVFQTRRMWQFCGVEIMRRLIGVAQLPVTYGMETKKELLNLSRKLVLQP